MRYAAFASLLFIGLSPLAAHAAVGLVQIVPQICACPDSAPAYGCVLQIIQNVIRVAIAIGFVLATLALVYTGFIWVTSAGNPGKVEQGRTLLINIVVGMVVMLGAWLMVDFVMKEIYNGANGGFGPWNDILAGSTSNGSADLCLQRRDQSSLTQGNVSVVASNIGNGVVAAVGGGSCTPIPDSGLVAIDNSGHKLIPDAAQRFTAMKAAAAADHINLVVTSAYRSPDQQTQAWNNNGCSLVNGRAVCQTRTAAVPCSLGGSGSNHTRGTAVDITLSGGVYAWLQQHAAQFGFYNRLANDLPHWSDTGT